MHAAKDVQVCLKPQAVPCSGGAKPFADARPASGPETGQIPRSPTAPARKAALAASHAPAQVDSAAARDGPIANPEPTAPESVQPAPLSRSGNDLRLDNGNQAAAEAAGDSSAAPEKQDAAAELQTDGHALQPTDQAPSQTAAAQPARAPEEAKAAARPQSAGPLAAAKTRPPQAPKPAASAPVATQLPAAAASVAAPAPASSMQETAPAAPPQQAASASGQANGKRKVLDDSDSDDSEDDVPLARRMKVRTTQRD